jgi:hypothetical protein
MITEILSRDLAWEVEGTHILFDIPGCYSIIPG